MLLPATLRSLPLIAVASLVGCAASHPRVDTVSSTAKTGAASEPRLRRIANSAISGKGFADVTLVDGVAYVRGDVANAIDRNAVVRALGGVAGVERVESLIKLDM